MTGRAGGQASGLRDLRIVALGGGHGLHATLSAVRRLTDHVTAVVTVADDGGSSGRLRKELGHLPPGDLRMAMTALAADDEAGRGWAALVQHRFGGSGALAGHAVGNLLLAGLMDTLGDPVAALDTLGDLLGVRGRVLPMACEPLVIEADVTGLGDDRARTHRIRGQVAVASTPGRVERVFLRPERPRACPEAVAAVREADVVVLGPGSWFSSVLPHLLVPELREALLETRARRLVVLNLAPEPGETAGYSPEQHLTVLAEHAPGLRVDAVLGDVDAVPVPDRLRAAAVPLLRQGGRVHLTAVAADPVEPRHDPAALAEALATLLAPPEPGRAVPTAQPLPARILAAGGGP